MSSSPDSPWVRFAGLRPASKRAEAEPASPWARFVGDGGRDEPSTAGAAPPLPPLPMGDTRPPQQQPRAFDEVAASLPQSLPTMPADAVRVAPTRQPMSAEAVADLQRAALLPGFINPPLPDIAAMAGQAQVPPLRPMQPDATAVATPGPPPRVPMIAPISPEHLAAVKEAERVAREGTPETQRYEALKAAAAAAAPGGSPVLVGLGLSAAKGVGEAATLGQLNRAVDLANRGVARLAGVDAPPEVDETFARIDRPALERAAELGGFMYGAGSLIASQNRLLARAGSKLPETSRLGRMLRTFDPAAPVAPATAALQSAAEGLPYDFAYHAETPEQRTTNVVAGLLLGGALGPVFRRTSLPKLESAKERVRTPGLANLGESVRNALTRSEVASSGQGAVPLPTLPPAPRLSRNPVAALRRRLSRRPASETVGGAGGNADILASAGPTLAQAGDTSPGLGSAAPVPEIEAPTQSSRVPPSVGEVPVAEIDVEPERFQFKLNVGEGGVGQELKSVQRFDPNLAGVIQVWRDPADGRAKVVNGHHRLELARRTGAGRVLVRYIDAPDAATARTVGAMTNIAEGRGTAVDAAKLFRDMGATPAMLEDRGISLRGAVARDGVSLARLPQTLFQDVVSGRLPVARAAVIGGSGLDDTQQLALAQLLTRTEKGGRRLTNETVGELIRFVRGAGTQEATELSLFGEETIARSLALEKAELSAYVKDRLAKDRRLFGFLTRAGRAGRIEEAGAGRIETGRASELAEGAGQAEEVYNRLSTMSGPVAQALNDAAAALARGTDAATVREGLYERVQGAVRGELDRFGGAGRVREATTGGDVATGGLFPETPDALGAGESPWARLAEGPGEVTTARGPGVARGANDALEVQEGLFGERAPLAPEEQQRSLFNEAEGAARPTLRAAEQQARKTVSQLREKIQAGTARASEVQRYTEALALLRRNEAVSAEEAALRARQSATPTQAGDTGELFGADALRGQVSDVGPRQRNALQGITEPRSDATADVDAILPVDEAAGRRRTRSLIGRLRSEGRLSLGREAEPGQVLDVPDRQGMVQQLAKTLGAPFRVGRMGSAARKGVLGFYKRKPEVVRVSTAQDIEVAAHEGAHHLHKTLFGVTPGGQLSQKPLMPWADELRPLSYEDEGRKTLKEGFAEFVRLYITNPAEVERAAPRFLAHFESAIESKAPEALAVFREVRENYRLWREAPAQARVRAQRARPVDGPAEIVGLTGIERAYTKVIDNLAPLRILTKEATGQYRPADLALDVGTLADLARGSAGQAELFIRRGVVDFKTRAVRGPSLHSVLDPIRKGGKIDAADYDNLVDYFIAKRVQYLYDARSDVGYLGIEKADADAVVRELESPEFKEALGRFEQWHRGLLYWLKDAGVMSEPTLRRIEARNRVYVPLMRELDTEDRGVTGGRGVYNQKDPVKRLKGSGRQILDPFEVSLQRAYEYTRLAAKQEVSNALIRLAELPGMGHIIELVPAEKKALQVPMQEIIGQLAQWGIEIPAQDIQSGKIPDEMMFFYPSPFLGDNTIRVIKDGIPRFYQVDPDLYRALNGLDEDRVSDLTRLASIPARTLRAGATLAPEFALRNPIRDQLVAGVQSEWGYVPFFDLARGLSSLLRKDEYYEAFMAGGGARSSLLGLDRATIRAEARKALGAGGKVENVITSPTDLLFAADRLLDPLRAFSSAMEDATRIGETRRALDSLTGAGVERGEAVRRAAKAGRDVSIDFARHGLEGARLRMMAAFWNATIQGYDRMGRAFRNDPAGASLRAAAMITVPSVLEYLVYRDDAEYWEIPQWQRDLFWVARLDNDTWLRVPKPFELGLVFGTLPQRMLQWMDRHDPEGVDQFVTQTLARQVENFAPVPTFLSPLIENFANYSTFLDRRIVPTGLERLDSREQYTDRTSSVAVGLGRLLGYSPMKIDNVIASYTGGLGRIALKVGDLGAESVGLRTPGSAQPLAVRLPGVRGLTLESPGAQAESIERLYRMRDEAEKAHATLRSYQRAGRADQARNYLRDHSDILSRRTGLNQAADALADMRRQLNVLRSSRLVPEAERQDRIREVEQRMMLLAAGATRGAAYSKQLATAVGQ
jgi:hypothetical protein